jgi:hypothetical protein
MSASPMPESARPSVSIPFNLYFHGLDKPHWSAEIDGFNADPALAERARKTRLLVAGARRRNIASLHDSIRRLDKAVNELSSLDETGFADAAAQHIDRRLAHTVSLCRTILADINGAVDAYRDDEQAATTPPPADDAGAEDIAEREAEDIAEREAEDLDAAADARAVDQVVTALAARVAAVDFDESYPTPADIARGTVTPIRHHEVWPPQ